MSKEYLKRLDEELVKKLRMGVDMAGKELGKSETEMYFKWFTLQPWLRCINLNVATASADYTNNYNMCVFGGYSDDYLNDSIEYEFSELVNTAVDYHRMMYDECNVYKNIADRFGFGISDL